MIKKTIITLLSVLCIASATTAFTACNNNSWFDPSSTNSSVEDSSSDTSSLESSSVKDSASEDNSTEDSTLESSSEDSSIEDSSSEDSSVNDEIGEVRQESILFSGSTITWDAIPNASYYIISINNVPYVVSAPHYDYTPTDDANAVSVSIYGVSENQQMGNPVTRMFIRMSSIDVSNIILSDNGVLSWQSVAGASAYQISINGEEYTVTDTSYTILTQSGSYVVKIKPLSINTNLFSVWSEPVEFSYLDAPSFLSYDGTKISWGEIKNAEKYIVYINDVPQTVAGTSINYITQATETEVVVSVCGVNANQQQGKKITHTFTRLETISESNITFDEMGVMSWGNIDGADAYLLSINGVEMQVTTSTYSEFPTGKQLNIKVRPYTTDGLTFSDWSKTYTKTYLPTVENIQYNGEKLTWRGINNAQKYELFIDGGEPIEISGKAYDYDAKQQTFSVQIKAKSSDPNVYSSALTEEKEFIFLPVIEDLTIADGQLIWPKVSVAESYDVQINGGTVQNVKGTSISLEAGQTLSIKVKPVTSGEVYFSDWSVAKPAYILDAPELQWFNNASLENGEEVRAISWDQVNGSVSGYQVKIVNPDGLTEIQSYSANTRDILHAFTTAGTYTVTVQATTDMQDMYASAYSAPIIVERLPAPTLIKQNPIVSDPTNNSQFSVTWNAVSFASGYKIYKNMSALTGVDIADYTAVIKNPIPAEATGATEQVYSIQTRGAGLESLANGVQRVRLSSIIPTKEGNNFDTCSFAITSEAMPVLDAEPTKVCAGQYMKWTGSSPKYAVRGVGSERPFGTSESQFDLYNLNAGRYAPSVCAQGDGATVLASNYTSNINVERLNSPANIHISSYMGDLPCISWDKVNQATSYNMTVNASTQVNDVNSGDAISKDWITASGVSISITALANEWENNVYWVTSKESPVKTFIKLDTPEFNSQKVRDGRLVWNAPGNASAVGNVFTYNLYNGDGAVVKSSLTTPSIALSDLGLQPGEHTFYVKCIAFSSCISSDMSTNPATFRILATPTLTHGETAYLWNPVIGAKTYEVLVNGEVVKTVDHDDDPEDPTTYYSYVPNKFEVGDVEYTVQIRAVGDDGYTTVDSEYYTIKQRTARLACPTFALSYTVNDKVSTTYDRNGYIVSTITEAVPNAKGYEFMIAGVSSGEISELTWKKLSVSTGVFTATVRAIGGKFVVDDENATNKTYTYWITSDESDEQEIVLHTQVQNIKKEVGSAGRISWSINSAEAPASGYTVRVYYLGEAEPVEYQVASIYSSIDITSNLNKVYKVEIIVNPANSDTRLEVGSKVAVREWLV